MVGEGPTSGVGCNGRLIGAGLGPPGFPSTSHEASQWDLVGGSLDSLGLASDVSGVFSASKAASAFGPALGVKVQNSPTATWLIGQVTDNVCTSALGLLGTGTGDVWAI